MITIIIVIIILTIVHVHGSFFYRGITRHVSDTRMRRKKCEKGRLKYIYLKHTRVAFIRAPSDI